MIVEFFSGSATRSDPAPCMRGWSPAVCSSLSANRRDGSKPCALRRESSARNATNVVSPTNPSRSASPRSELRLVQPPKKTEAKAVSKDSLFRDHAVEHVSKLGSKKLFHPGNSSARLGISWSCLWRPDQPSTSRCKPLRNPSPLNKRNHFVPVPVRVSFFSRQAPP